MLLPVKVIMDLIITITTTNTIIIMAAISAKTQNIQIHKSNSNIPISFNSLLKINI